MSRTSAFVRIAALSSVLFLLAIVAQPTNASAAMFERKLMLGSSGQDVADLQQILADKGFYTYPEITGYFGRFTEAAVAGLQHEEGLETVGYVGPRTRALLNYSFITSAPVGTPELVTTGPALPRELTLGDTGEDVYVLQQFLRKSGFFDYPDLTGYYGPVTAAAVLAFQKANGIDDATATIQAESISEIKAVPFSSAATAASFTTPTGTPPGSLAGGVIVEQADINLGPMASTSPTTTPDVEEDEDDTYNPPSRGSRSGGSRSNNTNDTTPPSVTLTAPADLSTVSGATVIISADASDNEEVIGVQFKLDGNNFQSEDTSAPYAISWDSRFTTNGTHVITAVARDQAGNATTSLANTVTVSNVPDTTAPIISGITSTPGATTAAIIWNTDELATTRVEYGVTTSYGQASDSQTLTLNHSAGLVSLSPSTTYHFRVISADIFGNTATSADTTFVTSAIPDTTSPVISNIGSVTSTSSATITWNTDEPSTSVVNYGLTTSYGAASSSPSSVTSHTITITGLTPATTYHYQVRSVDAAGNVGAATDRTFVTATLPDTTPPVISAIIATPTQTGAGITWTTNELSSSLVEYGLTTSYGQSVSSGGNTTSHSVPISSLTPSTLYHYRVISTDPSGNTSTSTDQTFTTAAPADTTPPVISSIVASASTTSATVSWNTDEAATADVFYGPTTAYGTVTSSAASVTSRTITLTGLTASTTYNYQVRSTDAAGNAATSTNRMFTTLPLPDTTAPVISALSATSTETTATITWTTNEPSTTVVPYGLTTSYGLTQSSASLVTSHTAILTGLSPSTLYHYRAASADAAGNTSTTTDQTITTLASAPGGGAFMNETAPFGRLSAVGAPVITVASTTSTTACSFTATTTLFQIDSGCNVTLAAGGVGNLSLSSYTLPISVTTSTTTGSTTLTVNIIPDQYDVGTYAQFAAVGALPASTLSGKTIALHRGNYNTGTVTTFQKPGLTSVLTIKKSDVESVKPKFDAFILKDTSNITFDGLSFQMTAWPLSEVAVFNMEGPTRNLIIKNSVFRHGYGPTNEEIDPTIEYPEFAFVAPNSMSAKLAYGISKDAIGRLGSFSFIDNTFTDLNNAIKFGAGDGDVVITGNYFSRIYTDFISLGLPGDTGGERYVPTSVLISWNVMTLPFGNTNDVADPHSDLTQFFANDFRLPYTPENMKNVTIEGNIGFTGLYNGVVPRGDFQGFPFADDMPPGKYYEDFVVRGNVNLSTFSGHGSTISSAKNTYAFGNTIVRDDPAASRNINPLNMSYASIQGAGTQAVLNNVTESVVLSTTTRPLNNVTLGKNGAQIPYTDVFVGPTFSPATVQEVLTKYAPKPGGLLANGVIGAIGNGYVDFANRTINTALEPSYVSFNDFIDQAPNTLVTSVTSRVRGGTNGRTISIAGGGSPQYRICADESCTTVVNDWTSAPSTVNVGQHVQIRFTTSSLGATTLTANLTIGSSTYPMQATTLPSNPFPSVEFDGVTPDYLRKASGGLNAGTATFTAVRSGSSIVDVIITSGGSNYEPLLQQPLIFSGASTTGAAGFAVDMDGNGVLDTVTITNPGNYTATPTVTARRLAQKFIIANRLTNATTTTTYVVQGSGNSVTITLVSNRQRNRIGSLASFDTTTAISTSSPKTLLCSIDLALSFANGARCYLDGVSVVPGSGTWVQGSALDLSNTAVTTWAVGATSGGGGGYLTGSAEFIYLGYGYPAIDTATGALLDLSSSTVRSRFTPDRINTINGSGPSGVAPQLFFQGDASVWNAGTNKGTGGNFVMNGAVSSTDTTAPVISSITATPLATSATVQWTTNEPAHDTLEYGTTTAYGSNASSPVDVTSHSFNITGLTPSTQYFFRVTSTDPSGNTATSTNQTFTTSAL